MNDHPARTRDVVQVHPGVKVGEHDLSGVHLTVVADYTSPATGARLYELNDHAGQLELTQYTGGEHYFLLPSDVDVITNLGVA
jgi:hypothetical protein